MSTVISISARAHTHKRHIQKWMVFKWPLTKCFEFRCLDAALPSPPSYPTELNKENDEMKLHMTREEQLLDVSGNVDIVLR